MKEATTVKIDPATRGGQYTLDKALEAGLFDGAVSYRSTGRPQSWVLVYTGGQVGRAVVTCYGFELFTLALSHRQVRDAVVLNDHQQQRQAQLLQRPNRWRQAS